MFKKIFFLILIVGLFNLGAFLFAEDITITTYYPSPYGNYNELHSNTFVLNPVNNLINCTNASHQEGAMYYNMTEHNIQVCTTLDNGTSWDWEIIAGATGAPIFITPASVVTGLAANNIPTTYDIAMYPDVPAAAKALLLDMSVTASDASTCTVFADQTINGTASSVNLLGNVARLAGAIPVGLTAGNTIIGQAVVPLTDAGLFTIRFLGNTTAGGSCTLDELNIVGYFK